VSRDPLDDFATRLFQAGREEPVPDATGRRIAGKLREQRAPANTSSATLVSWPKTRAAAALVAAVVAAGAFLLVRASSDPIDISAEPTPPPASAPAVDPPATAVLVPSGSPPEEPRPTPPTRAPHAPATLDQELVSLETARAALADGNPKAALAQLDRFERVLRGKQLEAEASLLRIEALAALGRHDRAAELARRFVVEHSTDPLVDRARNFITEPSVPDGGHP